MLADVVERAQLAVAAADAEQAFARDLEGEVIARIADLAFVPGELPCAGKKPRHLVREDRGVGVVARFKRMDEGGDLGGAHSCLSLSST